MLCVIRDNVETIEKWDIKEMKQLDDYKYVIYRNGIYRWEPWAVNRNVGNGSYLLYLAEYIKDIEPINLLIDAIEIDDKVYRLGEIKNYL